MKPQKALITTLGKIGMAQVMKRNKSKELLFEYFSSVFSISSQDNPKNLPHLSTKGLPILYTAP